ncbi:hypothetical protein MMC26_001400 [Xylographa opegraphella]|nr:hypothetical protein [Xylographa opegraphella]
MKPSTQLRLLRPSALTTTALTTSTTSILSTLPSPPKHTRPFVSNPLTPSPQTLSATRTLPYSASALYALIADIASYPTFLPYCTASSITSWSAPHPRTSTCYPRTATLTVGFQSYSETFHSHVFCQPDTAVEAVSGRARTTLQARDIPHYSAGADDDPAEPAANPLFTSLLTRWSLKSFPYKPPPRSGRPQVDNAPPESKPRTEVALLIEVQFASAVYAALSQAAAPKVAGMMVEAFEKRAREVLGEGDVGVSMGREVEGGRVGEDVEGETGGRVVGNSGLDGVVSKKESP